MRQAIAASASLFLFLTTCFAAAAAPVPTSEIRAILLKEFPILSQMDRAIYAPQSALFSASDFSDVRGDPNARAPIPKLACAATVYVMIERGFGKADAVIDDVYEPGHRLGANPAKLTQAVIEEMQIVDVPKIVASLKRGLPVVLHGIGGPLGSHYVLVVGATFNGDVPVELIANDPWPGQDHATPGRQTRLSVNGPLRDERLKVVFTDMRLVARKSPTPQASALAEPKRPEATPREPTPAQSRPLPIGEASTLIRDYYNAHEECADYFVLRAVALSPRHTPRANYVVAKLEVFLAPPHEPNLLGAPFKFGMCHVGANIGSNEIGVTKHLVVGVQLRAGARGWEIESMEDNPAVYSACLCPWLFVEDRVARCGGCGESF